MLKCFFFLLYTNIMLSVNELDRYKYFSRGLSPPFHITYRNVLETHSAKLIFVHKFPKF